MIERSHGKGRPILPRSRDLRALPPSAIDGRATVPGAPRSRTGEKARSVVLQQLRGNLDAQRLYRQWVRELGADTAVGRYLVAQAALAAVKGNDQRAERLLISAVDVVRATRPTGPKAGDPADVAQRAEAATAAKRAREAARVHAPTGVCTDPDPTEGTP